MLHLLRSLDPLRGDWYQFWSGIGGGSPLFVLLAVWVKHHNCHCEGCWRLGHARNGLVVCRRHRGRPEDRSCE